MIPMPANVRVWLATGHTDVRKGCSSLGLIVHENVPIDVSTLAGWVGAVTTALSPLVTRTEAHVRGAERPDLDDTPVPVLAKG